MSDRQSDIATVVLSREELENIHGEMIYLDGSEEAQPALANAISAKQYVPPPPNEPWLT